jgi:hypothetical protein
MHHLGDTLILLAYVVPIERADIEAYLKASGSIL